MLAIGSTRTTAVLLLAILVLGAPLPARAQQKGPDTPARSSPALRRSIWTAIGAGAGFGAGLLLGVSKFDDAIDSDRKVWTSAGMGAAAGALTGLALSWRVGRSQPMSGTDDPLWEGMAAGAAVGAAVGVFLIPSRTCKPANPECPLILGVGVGIPAIAVGAAVGALVDKLRK